MLLGPSFFLVFFFNSVGDFLYNSVPGRSYYISKMFILIAKIALPQANLLSICLIVSEWIVFYTSAWTSFGSIFIWLSHEVILVKFELGLSMRISLFWYLVDFFGNMYNGPDDNRYLDVRI